ncbi:hypothetical protein VTN00DRAFT_1394 [Thermoascus crustaceus]|uniref:uncharacterized protein n=1 Tax=Thermoascus crustaceus TaxID=5088 RepID=UPI00374303BA
MRGEEAGGAKGERYVHLREICALNSTRDVHTVSPMRYFSITPGPCLAISVSHVERENNGATQVYRVSKEI